jgi:hypothetical protein
MNDEEKQELLAKMQHAFNMAKKKTKSDALALRVVKQAFPVGFGEFGPGVSHTLIENYDPEVEVTMIRDIIEEERKEELESDSEPKLGLG